MDAPWKYHGGFPINEETREVRDERTSYIQNVKEAEEEKGCDHNLSTMLASRYFQNIATVLRFYMIDGKIGYYCKVLDQFDETTRQIVN